MNFNELFQVYTVYIQCVCVCIKIICIQYVCVFMFVFKMQIKLYMNVLELLRNIWIGKLSLFSVEFNEKYYNIGLF